MLFGIIFIDPLLPLFKCYLITMAYAKLPIYFKEMRHAKLGLWRKALERNQNQQKKNTFSKLQ